MRRTRTASMMPNVHLSDQTYQKKKRSLDKQQGFDTSMTACLSLSLHLSPVCQLQHLMHIGGAHSDLARIHELDYALHRLLVEACLAAPLLHLHPPRHRLRKLTTEQRREVIRGRGQDWAVCGELEAVGGSRRAAERQRHVAEEPELPLLVLPSGELWAVGRGGELLGLLGLSVSR